MFFQRKINYRERKKKENRNVIKADDAVKELRKSRDRLKYLKKSKVPNMLKKIDIIKADQKKATKKKKAMLNLKLAVLSKVLNILKAEQSNIQIFFLCLVGLTFSKSLEFTVGAVDFN